MSGTPACQDFQQDPVGHVKASTGCDTFNPSFLATGHGDAFASADTNLLTGSVNVNADSHVDVSARAFSLFDDVLTFTNNNVATVEFTGKLHADISTDFGSFVVSAKLVLVSTDLKQRGCYVLFEDQPGGIGECVTTFKVSPGQPFTVEEFLELTLSGDGLIGPFRGSIDANHTGSISLITALDANGNIIPDPGLISASGFNYQLNQGSPAPPGQVPEPTSMTLLGTGLLGLAGVLRRSSFSRTR